MKKVIGLFCTLFGLTLIAAPGCMDNSYHLKQRYDNKNYHHVDCNCPCEKKYKILADRGQCIKCKHYRDPRHSAIALEQGRVTCPVRVATRTFGNQCYPSAVYKDKS